MSKYINAYRLIAEIDRRIDSWSIRGKNSPVGQGKDTCESRVTELSDLRSFITSLQQEQPEVDLEKEIGHWMDKLDDKYCILVEDYSIQDIKDTARHFYELGLNARKEK